MSSRTFFRTSLLTTLLAFVVVVLGAYVRLSDAGLGCPDWPGCYGQIVVPDAPAAIAEANAAYPDRPVEAAKGWKEMIHRYFAGVLGILIATLAVIAWRNRHRPGQPVRVPLALVALVIFQAALGMWTVTLKLNPVIVMAHLLGGLATLSLLWWQTLRAAHAPAPASPGRPLRLALALGLAVVIGQIALGGWTSANYAALACNEFPTCTLGQVWPSADFAEGFDFWHDLDGHYEFATHLSYRAKVAIHLMHRVGAVVTTVITLAIAFALWRSPRFPGGRRAAAALLLLVAAQFALGVSNVLFSLPLPVAVAHNAGAALLLLAFVTLNHLVRPQGRLSSDSRVT